MHTSTIYNIKPHLTSGFERYAKIQHTLYFFVLLSLSGMILIEFKHCNLIYLVICVVEVFDEIRMYILTLMIHNSEPD